MSSRPFATLVTAFRDQAAEARERGAPAAVPSKCWWRASIARSTLAPVPLHPEPLDLGPGGLEGFKTALDALRSKAHGYLCPWCPTGRPKRYKYVSRAVHHFATKHTELWAALGADMQTQLVAATPAEWEAAFAIMPLLPTSAPGSKCLEFLGKLRSRMTEEPDAARPQSIAPPPPPPPPLPPLPASALPPTPTPSPAPPATAAAPATASAPPAAPAPASVLVPLPTTLVTAQLAAPRASPHAALAVSTPTEERDDSDDPPVPTPPVSVAKLTALQPEIGMESSSTASSSHLVESQASDGGQRRRKHTLEPAESKRRGQPRQRYSPPGSPRRAK